MNLLFFVFTYLFADTSEITSHVIKLPNAIAGYDIEIEQHAIPQKLLTKVIREVLQREKTDQLTITHDEKSLALAKEIEGIASASKIPSRSLDENSLNQLLPKTVDAVSGREQNGLRALLIIRCVGLGAGLFVGTGSSLAIAAYAGILNYIMMEVLYIPKRNGHMPGVDFVNRVMDKSTQTAKSQEPTIGNKRLGIIGGFTNFLVNYTMNFAMLVPFLGMTGADFESYLRAFTSVELYVKSAYIATVCTLFLSSWKMAASRWEQARKHTETSVISAKSGSRLINGIDFLMSFVNPGFWAGNFANEMIVSTVGISGFVAYFYYDIKSYVGTKWKRLVGREALTCKSIF